VTIPLCDFRNKGARRIKLDAADVAPLVHLHAGHRDLYATLDVPEATILRDALTKFIDAASALAPHAATYAARLAGEKLEAVEP
jgi:hypothetical protein